MKLNNIELLRDHILESLVKLEKKKIDIGEASIIAKCGEVVMSSIKLQLAYSQMIGHEPNIKFLQDCHKGTHNGKMLINEQKPAKNK